MLGNIRRNRVIAKWTVLIFCLTSIWSDCKTIGYAEENEGTIVASGKCGYNISDSVEWKIDSENTLTISGKGNIKKLEDVEAMEPYFDTIKKVIMTGKVELATYLFTPLTNLVEADLSENSVLKLTSSSFYRCKKMQKVSLPETLTTIEHGAFLSCMSLKEITLPPNLKSMGQQVFRECSSLEKIVIPKSITCVDDGSFYKCTSLKEIELPEGITNIDYFAFNETAISEIELPNSLEYIDSEAFSACSNLKNIYFRGNAPTIEGQAFCFVKANAYYPQDDDTWTEEKRKNYDGTLNWIAWDGENVPQPTEEPTVEPSPTEEPSPSPSPSPTEEPTLSPSMGPTVSP
ncbi:MAG: leucine-rich repeat domain-containing protein, partial [Clostridiales bacterium]|nr:leucine-rich repeat domain-containing protein [Clostridiales bacterium]